MEERLRRRFHNAYDRPDFPPRDLVWRAMERIDEQPEHGHRREWAVALAALLLAAAALATFGVVSQRLVLQPQPAHSPVVTTPPSPGPVGETPVGGPSGRLYFVSPEVGWRVVTPVQSGPTVMYKTTDGGRTWKEQLRWQLNAPVFARFDDSRNGVVVTNSQGVTTIWRTTDGSTWQSTSAPPDFGLASFVSAREGWYTSVVARTVYVNHTTDGGQTWQRVGSITAPDDNFGGRTIYFGDASNGYVPGFGYGTVPPLYVTHDGGARWSPITLQPPPTLAANKAVAATEIRFAPDGTTFVVMDVYTGNQASYYLYVSADGGRTWSQPRPLPVATGSTVDPVDGNHLWQGGLDSGLWRSDDAGQTWTKVAATVPPTPSTFFNPTARFADVQFLNSTVGWAYIEQWEQCNGRGQISPVPGWPQCPSGSAQIRRILVKTTDGGQTWTEVAPLS